MDRVVLTASEGMILTNGNTYATRIELENYREIPIEEYNKIYKE